MILTVTLTVTVTLTLVLTLTLITLTWRSACSGTPLRMGTPRNSFSLAALLSAGANSRRT